MAFVCFSNDFMDRMRRKALTAGPDEVRKFNQHVTNCLNPIKSWALASGGSIVSDDPCVSIYEVSASALSEVGKLLARFKQDSQIECWVGVGSDMVDSVRAADLAKRKNLQKPYLMREEILDEPEPQRQVVKAERELLQAIPSAQEENLQKAASDWLKRASIVAMLATGGHAVPPPKPVAPVVASQPEKQPEKQPEAPVRLQKPIKYRNPRYNNTFLSHYNPVTLSHGAGDVLWAINMAESSGGRDFEHMPQRQTVNHPLTNQRVEVDNTAFGHLGLRPMTAFETYVKHMGGRNAYIKSIMPKHPESTIPVKMTKQKENALGERVFMKKFYEDPHFYNEVSRLYLNKLIEKFGQKSGDHVVNPMDVVSAWHYGLYSDRVKEDPHGYKNKVLGHISNAAKSGRKLDFSDSFGKEGHDKIIQLVNSTIPQSELLTKEKKNAR